MGVSCNNSYLTHDGGPAVYSAWNGSYPVTFSFWASIELGQAQAIHYAWGAGHLDWNLETYTCYLDTRQTPNPDKRRLVAYARDTGGQKWWNTTVGTTDDQVWQHYGFIHASSTDHRVYVDGTEWSYTDSFSALSAVDGVRIGGRPGSSAADTLIGDIAECMIATTDVGATGMSRLAYGEEPDDIVSSLNRFAYYKLLDTSDYTNAWGGSGKPGTLTATGSISDAGSHPPVGGHLLTSRRTRGGILTSGRLVG